MWEEKTPETLKAGQTHVAAVSVAVVFSSVGRAGGLSITSVCSMIKILSKRLDFFEKYGILYCSGLPRA
jgi:hypothetical protein